MEDCSGQMTRFHYETTKNGLLCWERKSLGIRVCSKVHSHAQLNNFFSISIMVILYIGMRAGVFPKMITITMIMIMIINDYDYLIFKTSF